MGHLRGGFVADCSLGGYGEQGACGWLGVGFLLGHVVVVISRSTFSLSLTSSTLTVHNILVCD